VSKVPSPSAQLARFIAKFDQAIARLICECRGAMRKRFPTAYELVYDNYNFFVIGYSSSERPSDCIASLAASSKGLVLSFYYGATVPDPSGILLGSGTQNRFVRIPTVTTLQQPAVDALLRAAAAQGETPLPASGGGRLIIRSVSVKQRSRRRVTLTRNRTRRAHRPAPGRRSRQ
jgi:hypothetical protein